MGAELQKLAQQFKASGNKDIAAGISAWATVAKSRGLETFSETPVLPEGAIRLPDLTIGGKTPKELEKALASDGFRVSDWARDMLRDRSFTTLPEQQTLSLVRVKVADLGLTDTPTTDQIYAKANELGLDLCPAEVGPQLRLAYKDQPMDEWLYVGMKQIADSYGYPNVYELDRDTDGSWLSSYWARPDDRWYPENTFVFSLRK